MLSISGLPVIALEVGAVILFSLPVWLAAKMVDATHPTLLRSITALFIGLLCTLVSVAVAGGAALFLAPLFFFFSFKFVFGTTFFGALILCILAAIGYAAMVHFIGADFSFTGNPVNV